MMHIQPNTMDAKATEALVKRLRIDRRLSQRQAAEMTGVKYQAAWSDIENVKYPATPAQRAKIAEVFGVSEAELFNERGFAK